MKHTHNIIVRRLASHAFGMRTHLRTRRAQHLGVCALLVACGLAGRAWAQGAKLFGWGYNGYFQTTTPANLSGVTQVACGWSHTYALKNNGTLVGWGYNSYGQTTTPANLSGVTQVACGSSHTYALKYDSTVVGWGDYGNGATATPANLSGVTQVACGAGHTYALRPWRDCNGNGIFDGDDIVSGFEWDLNNDFTPDSCGQGVVPVRLDSGNLDVPTANLARSFTFPLSRRVDAPVAVRIRAVGDLEANTEYLTVRFNGVTVRRCFETNGVNCVTGLSNQDVISVSAADFNGFVDTGSLTVTLLPSPAVTASECPDGGMWVSFEYPGIGPDGDCDGDGVLDTRQIGLNSALDRNRNARLDACEIRDDPSVDCNGNGQIDSYDIATGTADDNGNGRIDRCEYDKGDLDLNAIVDGGDMAILLLYFGEIDSPIGDLDRNGLVDMGDAAILLMNFGPVTWP